ncbi:hypothetical protein IWX83_002264 [Flavobacterium sp. CG_9.1]|uniref:hypothetical protein n=1 Tax=Flavobacterium sp. CG_9.1 TaxID=2787728 RepID=UPI0018CB49D4|nr:hypothetical protein [Flavobacterium sp. CG_9.1]MBG6062464.1 hypothetical protein [Flavobacterium sp. CG_9.1]
MKKLLFTAIAVIAFSGLAMANNETKTTSAIVNLQFEKEEKTKTNTLEEKDVWFCHKISESSSYNFMTKETTVTTTYQCTWYDLSPALTAE